ALKLAKFAPKLALLVPEAGGAEGRREHRENLVRAYALLGGAYRATGQHAAADPEYRRAQRLADSEALSPVARAELGLRIAVLRARTDRFSEALDLVDIAETAYRQAGDRRRLAEAHAMRGYVLNEAERYSAAIPCHGKALTLALELQRTKAADPADVAALAQVVEAARANMAWAVTHAPSLHAVSETRRGVYGVATEALSYIDAAYRELRGRRNSLTRHLLQWTEGRIHLRMRRPERAEKRFHVARCGFVRLEVPWETALVSLDLAALYRAGERWGELEDLAADTFGRFRELAADFEAIAALSLWVDAVEARRGVKAAIAAAREKLEARKARP
ncbi:MAG: hypothetical protein GY719_21845, partial [bacterium]|nr:hypothetical protein [bacterium]